MVDEKPQEDVLDCLVAGGGPAGLTAALYASRSGMTTLVLEGKTTVSQITVTDIIENYPGVPQAGGFEFHDRIRTQALGFGARASAEDVQSLKKTTLENGLEAWEVVTGDNSYRALSVIIASGARWRSLGVPGEEKFLGRGVSYCATCDGPFYRGRSVAVVGGGDTAIQEALFLTKFADKVTVIHRRERLRAAAILQERAFANPKIDFYWNGVIEGIEGDDFVKGVKVRNLGENGEITTLPLDGVFIFIGLDPQTEFVKGVVNLDDGGYIITDSSMRTSQRGIFAAGDCIAKSLRQVVTACGDGATAAHEASLHVDDLKGRSY